MNIVLCYQIWNSFQLLDNQSKQKKNLSYNQLFLLRNTNTLEESDT